MIKTVICGNCGSEINIGTWRKFVVCPYCDSRFPFEGFQYRDIDFNGSMYAGVELWTDCPACRSKNMYRGAEVRAWKCPDCGYLLSEEARLNGVLWFCDDCETFLNVQPGFSAETGKWKCTECGFENDVTEDNII